MNLKTFFVAAMLSSGALLVGGCATTGHEQTAGEVIDDAAITAKVKAALLDAKDVNSLAIEVKTFNGVVQLSGFVNSEWQISQAGKIAASVKGVRSVKNDLIHKPN